MQAALFGKVLEITFVTPVNPARSRKGRPMWIYDGEQWIEEGVNETVKKPETAPRPEEMYQPELQVIEIIPVQKPFYVPPYPMA
ncbi:MAG TPA: hypothetical protein VL284_12150 [Thermoanaerobaculia bacterium]|nr:hypothetical protein [Thermoanaerobaculia bacterium]